MKERKEKGNKKVRLLRWEKTKDRHKGEQAGCIYGVTETLDQAAGAPCPAPATSVWVPGGCPGPPAPNNCSFVAETDRPAGTTLPAPRLAWGAPLLGNSGQTYRKRE